MGIKMSKINSLSEYKDVSEFFAGNIHKVSSNAQAIIPNIKTFMQENIKDLFFLDENVMHPTKWEWAVKKYVLWKDICNSEHNLFIFKEKNKNVAFALLEKSRMLRYLYVDDTFQRQGIGSEILKRLSKKGTLRVKVEEKEYVNGLSKFYEKNGFVKTGENISMETKYHQYEMNQYNI